MRLGGPEVRMEMIEDLMDFPAGLKCDETKSQ